VTTIDALGGFPDDIAAFVAHGHVTKTQSASTEQTTSPAHLGEKFPGIERLRLHLEALADARRAPKHLTLKPIGGR